MYSCVQLFRSSVARVPKLCIAEGQRNLSVATPLHSRKQSLAEELGLLNAPPLPTRPFHKYAEQMRNEHRNLPWSERRKKISEAWKTLEEEEKQKRLQEYEKEKNEYKESFLEFMTALSPHQVMRLKGAMDRRTLDTDERVSRRNKKQECEALGRPKRPLNPFQLFMMQAEGMTGHGRELISVAAEQWRGLDAAQRQGYLRRHEHEMREYHKRLDAWEQRMCVEGRLDLVRKTSKRQLREQARENKAKEGTGL